MDSVRKSLASATGERVRRRPLADCTNSLKSDNSSSSSSVSLLKKTPLPFSSSVPLDGVRAEDFGVTDGAWKSIVDDGGRRSVKRKCPAAVAMTAALAIGDSLGNLDEVKDCEVSRSIILPHKRKKQHLRGRPRKESDQALEDYVTQQRIYFAEVDAYELEEEEVAEGEALE